MHNDTLHVTDEKYSVLNAATVVEVDSTAFTVHRHFTGSKSISQALENFISRKIERCS
ncbi:hypothetical protein [Hydrogenoanaerobacterium sp.]|uniref:hypothetical protein n=1 Tax=Hydrogenoanaerobacterium sp. TaxID=2953763 RepID=UPI002899ACD4|nr:hypothetical protein [Hydrogenoanaerobacterium sp.]